MVVDNTCLKILAIGTIMIDILAVEMDKIAEPGEVVYLNRDIEARIGGHPVDVGIDLAKLGINPEDIGVVAAVGRGLFGDYARKIIEQHRLRAFLQDTDTVDTGKNLVLEKKGEDRRFHIDPGANWLLAADYVIERIKETAPVIVCIRPGYSGIDLQLEQVFRVIKEQGSFLFLDIMQFHPKRSQHMLLPLLHYADAIHCNEKEAMVTTGADNPVEAIDSILQNGAKVVFLTRGEKGAAVISEKVLISQPDFAVDFVDATGAGDAFCAGVVHKMIEKGAFKDIHEMGDDFLIELLTMGQVVGATAVTATGCVEGVSAEKVKKLLKSQKSDILHNTTVTAY